MDLKKAIDITAKFMDKSNIIAVTSDTAIYLLDNAIELDVIKEHAKANKLEMFIVKDIKDVQEKQLETKKTKK